jgi:hypothetical protein
MRVFNDNQHLVIAPWRTVHTWRYNAAPLGLIGRPTRWPQAAESGSLGVLEIHRLASGRDIVCAPMRPDAPQRQIRVIRRFGS